MGIKIDIKNSRKESIKSKNRSKNERTTERIKKKSLQTTHWPPPRRFRLELPGVHGQKSSSILSRMCECV
jgi:hypothetical protein